MSSGGNAQEKLDAAGACGNARGEKLDAAGSCGNVRGEKPYAAGTCGTGAGRKAPDSRARSCIKICGLSRPCDIDYVNVLKPDYIGFVFAKSRRQVSVGQARLLRQRLDPEICAVGVFVNEAPERIVALVNDGIIDMVQLHGQEDEAYIRNLRSLLAEQEIGRKGDGPAALSQDGGSGPAALYKDSGGGPEALSQDSGSGPAALSKEGGSGEAALPKDGGQRQGPCPIIQAFSIRSPEDVTRACESSADYILLDQGAGGTGKTFDWGLIGQIKRPFFLAGGLGPDNIKEALKVGAFALDISSGAETGGYKDFEKIELCINAVCAAE